MKGHRPLLLVSLALICGGPLAWSQDQPSPSAAAADSEVTKSADVQEAAATEGGEREWLVDEESGQRYRIEKLPKVEGTYRWLDENHVLMPAGAQFEVVEHDDRWFFVKAFEMVPLAAKLAVPKGPTEEELAAAAATYAFELQASDRLAFEEFGNGLPRSGQWRDGFDLGDMNEDGHLDIVFGPARKGLTRPNIFLGDSAGGWRLWSEARYPNLAYDYGDAEAADFDGDGHLDLALGVHLRGLVVLRGDGLGRFETWNDGMQLYAPGTPTPNVSFSSRAVGSADWNGDGKLDLVAFGEGPRGTGQRTAQPQQLGGASRGFGIYLNKGDGSWLLWNPMQPEDSRPNFGSYLVIEDVNGDGAVDLLGSSSQMGSKAILYLADAEGRVTTTSIDELRSRAQVTAVEVMDADRDGRKDLVVAYLNRELDVWRGGVDLLLQRPELSWERRVLFSEESRRGIEALATGDLDGDGLPDIGALTGNGEVLLFLATEGSGFTYEREALTTPEEGCSGSAARIVDLDGDGAGELIASFAGEPTGMPGLVRLSQPGCTNEGSLRAWRGRPREAGAAP